MITVTPSMLTDLGIDLNQVDTDSFIGHIQETLEERIGIAIAELLDDDEVSHLIKLTEADNEPATEAWLNIHVPEYKDVVKDEFDILMGEIAQLAAAV